MNSCYKPCGFYNDVERVTTQPKSTELAGTYKPDEISIRALKSQGLQGKDFGEVTIAESGQFSLNNVPESFLDKSSSKVLTANGTWKLYFDKHSKTNEIIIKYDSLGQLKGLVDGLRLYKRNGKLIMFRFLGDPDNCKCLFYERQ